MAYVDVYVVPVPRDQLEAYKAFAEATKHLWTDEGCLELVEMIGDDVPAGQLTSFPQAVQAGPDEVVAVGYVVWPDKATRDAAATKMRQAGPPPDMKIPFDGKRMFWGGFTSILQWKAPA